jgi:hypothetical protein
LVNDFHHRVEDLLRLFPKRLAQVGDHLLEMVLVLEQTRSDQETHADSHFAVEGVDFDEDVVVRTLVVAESEPS